MSEDTIARGSQMLGLQHKLTQLFKNNLASTSTHTRRSGSSGSNNDVYSVIRTVQCEKLLDDIPCRVLEPFSSSIIF